MKLQEILGKTTQFFQSKKIESARLDAELLLAHALGFRRIDLYLRFDQPLSEPELEKCRSLVRRRATGEPVAYILNEKTFFGNSFYVDQNVLIPRPETELLLEHLLEILNAQTWVPKNILDLGSGSGCLGLSLLKIFPQAKLTLVDISPTALQVSEKNAQRLQLHEHCEFLLGDVAQMNFPAQYDVVVANPPYIDRADPRVQKEVREFEPAEALFADQQGLSAIYQWISKIAPQVSTSGILACEFGADQSEKVQNHCNSLQIFNDIHIIKDFSGWDRHIFAQRRA